MLTERLKKLANQYLKDEWQLSKKEKDEVAETFFFLSTHYGNTVKTEIIYRGGHRVGTSYDYNDIVWSES